MSGLNLGSKRLRFAHVLCGLLAVFGGLGAWGGRTARAESPDALYRRGVELRRAGKDAEALEAFRKLNESEKSPRATAQMGLAEQALGLWVEAEAHVREALNATDDKWIKKNRATLTGALSVIEGRLGSVEIWGEPVGAEVLIDGKVVATLPMSAPVRVVVGDLPVTVRAPGYLARTTTVTVVAKQSSRERVVLQRTEAPAIATTAPGIAPAPRSTAPAAAAPSPSPTVAPATSLARASEPEPPSSPPTLVRAPSEDRGSEPSTLRGAWKWIAWGTGAAALGVGIYGTLQQNSKGDSFDKACGLDPTGTPMARLGSNQSNTYCAGLKTDVDSWYRTEVIGLVAAGALGASGFVLWLSEPRAGETKTTSASLGCAPGIGGLGSRFNMTCALTF
jgi:hypothetical protein